MVFESERMNDPLWNNTKRQKPKRKLRRDQKRPGRNKRVYLEGVEQYRWGARNKKWKERKRRWEPLKASRSGWFSLGQALWFSGTHTPIHPDRSWQEFQAAVCLASQLWFTRPRTSGLRFHSLIWLWMESLNRFYLFCWVCVCVAQFSVHDQPKSKRLPSLSFGHWLFLMLFLLAFQIWIIFGLLKLHYYSIFLLHYSMSCYFCPCVMVDVNYIVSPVQPN